MQVYSNYHNYIRRHNEYCFRFSDNLSNEETFYQIIFQPETGFIVSVMTSQLQVILIIFILSEVKI